MFSDIKLKLRLIFLPVVVFVVLIAIFYRPWIRVYPGEVCLVLTMGSLNNRVLDEGFYFVAPWIQEVKLVSMRLQKQDIPVSASSMDLQNIQAGIVLHYFPERENILSLYRNVGEGYPTNMIEPLAKEVAKSMFARYTVEEMIRKRSHISDGMKMALSQKLKSKGIILDEVLIVDFKFSSGYREAIEKKQIAEQHVKRAELELEQARIEKQSVIVKAEGEAEALRLKKSQLNNNIVELKRVEALKKGIEKWDGKMPMVTGSSMPIVNFESMLNGVRKEKEKQQ